MKKIIFIADFFLEQGINGGAEICNDQLIKMFISDGYEVIKINSKQALMSSLDVFLLFLIFSSFDSKDS